MTPTLTNAQKYSSEFGFEPRAVVEVIRTSGTISVGMFDRFYDGDIKIVETEEYSGDTASRWIDVSNIKSIRLLSGPWAVWQFAPKGAVGCNIVGDNDIFWFCSNELVNGKKWGEGSEGYMPRPWWWLEGQK